MYIGYNTIIPGDQVNCANAELANGFGYWDQSVTNPGESRSALVCASCTEKFLRRESVSGSRKSHALVTMDRDSVDRRRHTRQIYRGRASVFISGMGVVEGEAVDISDAGVCMTLPTNLHVGSLYQLNIEVLDQHKHITVTGRVCFALRQEGRYRVGLHCADVEQLRSIATVHKNKPLR